MGNIPLPNNGIAKKVKPCSKALLQTRLKQADQIVGTMRGEFRQKLGEDLARMEELWVNNKKTSNAQTDDGFFKISHNIKGQAATFGFPLVTEAAKSFCHLLIKGDKKHPKYDALISMHLQTFDKLYRQNDDEAELKKAKEAVMALQAASEALSRE